jgi:hypothetical protein
VQHGVRGEVHQVASVEERNDLYALWKNMLVQICHLLVDGIERGIGFGAFPQQHDAFHDVIVVRDLAILAVKGLADTAQPDLRPLRDRGNIPDVNGRALLSLDDRLPDILHVIEEPDGAHVDLLQPLLDETTSGIDVVAG